MLARSLANLNRRRANPDENQKGFTLIELLVVVIIIGILAAIAIPVYLGIQNNAKDSGVKSDLTNAKIAIIALQTTDGIIPPSATALSESSTVGITAVGYTKGANTLTIGYTKNSVSTFCIGATSKTGSVFFVTETLGVTAVTTTPAVALPSGCTA